MCAHTHSVHGPRVRPLSGAAVGERPKPKVSDVGAGRGYMHRRGAKREGYDRGREARRGRVIYIYGGRCVWVSKSALSRVGVLQWRVQRRVTTAADCSRRCIVPCSPPPRPPLSFVYCVSVCVCVCLVVFGLMCVCVGCSAPPHRNSDCGCSNWAQLTGTRWSPFSRKGFRFFYRKGKYVFCTKSNSVVITHWNRAR